VRIVSLIPSATEIIAALGLEDQLVGITHSCDYPPGVAHLPRVTSTRIPKDATSLDIDRAVKESVIGGTPLYDLDVDLLERLEPDLIVTQGVCDVCAVGETQAVACLSDMHARPDVLSLHPHRFADVMDDVVRVGRAAGAEGRALALVDVYTRRIEGVRARVNGGPPTPVVVLEWIEPPYSCGHWTPELVALAGGVELLAGPGDRSHELSWDEIRAADPEALVLACCGQDVVRTLEDLKFLESQAGFGELRAVKRRRVYVADGGALFSRPGPRLVDALELLSATLHGHEGVAGLESALEVSG
jgi:iron complex transport system substrate-binding protein